jgi:hypothetical protein
MKLSLLLSSLFVASALFGEPGAEKADSLTQALTAFNWSWENYASGVKRFEDIQFYKGGLAENPQFFTARWEITGSRTVTLHNTNRGTPSNGKRAYLVFDASLTRYVGIDFNGKTNVEGFRRESVDPDRAPEKGEQLGTDPRKGRLPDAGAIQASPVGLWHWFIGPDVSIKEDGTADLETGHGHWNWTDKERREFRIVWDASKFVDSLTLSPDGLHVSGKNNQGVTVTGERIKQQSNRP